MGKLKRDPIEYLKEWNDHLYNPGYWINRYTPFDYPSRSRSSWLIILIQILFFGIAAIFSLAVYLSTLEKYALFLFIILGIFVVIEWRYLKITDPAQKNGQEQENEVTSQVIINHQKRHPKKKNLPKRRKDYK